MKTVLSIAGSDSSGGAGIQADIKTIEALGCFAQTAITALTAQNTLGVEEVFDITPAFVAKQIDVVFDDIRPDAVKVGMVSTPKIVEAVADSLDFNGMFNIVVDPVMVATSGSSLSNNKTVDALCRFLIPQATVVTPNIPEAEVLAKMSIENAADQEKAAFVIAERFDVAALVKGGHNKNDANDVLARYGEDAVWFTSPRVETTNTHGTGCTLSSAIACGLAEGKPLKEAVAAAKEYLFGALSAGLDLGKGTGPIDHSWNLCISDKHPA